MTDTTADNLSGPGNSSPRSPEQGGRGAAIAYKRDKRTKSSVLWADFIADRVITIGGLFVIAVVASIMVFLISVTLPLFSSGSLLGRSEFQLADGHGRILSARMDENLTIAADTADDGTNSAFHFSTGAPLAMPAFDLGGKQATAFARTLRGEDLAFGFADGTVRLGRAELKVRIVTADALPADLKPLNDRDFTDGKAVFSKVPGGQYRRVAMELSLEAPVQVAAEGTAIVQLDYRVGGPAERPVRAFVTVDAAGTTRLNFAFTRVNMMTGERITTLQGSELPAAGAATDITKVLMNAPADRVVIATRDGTLRRYDTRDFKQPVLAETRKVLPDGVSLTALGYLNGETSLVVGGSDGSVSVWFGVDRKSPETSDGYVLTEVHKLSGHRSPVAHISVSQRTRMFVTADDAGEVALHHATTARTLMRFTDGPDRSGLQTLLLSPRDDAITAIGKNGKVVTWLISQPHPETTFQSLFGRIWYEGYAEPTYTWQSTASLDSFEPKLSLVPVIFGTFKASVYALIFAVPIALMAAIYTSEFMHFKVRAVVKPVMELMATLPSVVIGFVAALVISPVVETWISAVVIAFGVVPLSLIAAAFLWQTLPKPLALRYDGIPKFILYFVVLALSVWFSMQLGPLVERLFFGGDFKVWTTGVGDPTPFTLLMLLPFTFMVVFIGTDRLFGLRYKTFLRTQSYQGAIEIGRWLTLSAIAFLLALALAAVLSGGGYEPRGNLVGTYVQRNTLIAAFAIGFAMIPIVYTIAEDALTSVPEHLRAASLACGATRWQTASNVIVPTAGSGIFSAVMIGLGRAVGETMIVVMATGNTPVTEWNLFNGLRALSANINVELPEAVRDSTLYRTLFLCGLALFVVTFILNTVAEMVRQRFRKRAAQL
jgi:phosphate transport system permease protein